MSKQPATPIYAEMQKEMVWDIPPIKLEHLAEWEKEILFDGNLE